MSGKFYSSITKQYYYFTDLLSFEQELNTSDPYYTFIFDTKKYTGNKIRLYIKSTDYIKFDNNNKKYYIKNIENITALELILKNQQVNNLLDNI